MKRILFVINILIILLGITGCNSQLDKLYDFNFAMYYNTVNNVKIVTDITNEDELNKIYQGIESILQRVDNSFNVLPRAESFVTELMMVNNAAGINPVQVSDEVILVLEKALEIAKISEVDGVALFDPTIAPVWNCWDFTNNYYSIYNPIIASVPQNIGELLPLVDYHKVIINKETKTVYLEDQGMALDLGGIVKGYVADCVRTYLQDNGLNNAVIDIGKNIILMGTYLKKGWKVSLQTPFIEKYNYDREEEMYYYGRLYLSDKTIVTSGIYEKYIKDKDQNEYHHILDPRTGFPFKNNVVSVSVITESSIEADGYSTALLALGLEKGMELVAKTVGLEVIYVVENNEKYEVYISSGLRSHFDFNENVIKLGYEYKGVFGE
ncbi:MAG TPA: FAD:protein FMN transferase [Bacilli bacterium]|nr:FAD:protein FMN transferase [Bacilli bacterium]